MTIDIVTYTDEQYAAMTQEQLKEVRDAQTEKDELKIELEDTLKAERAALVKKGIFNSNLYQMIKTKLEKEYEALGKLLEGEWKKTKRKIRKRVLWKKGE